MKIALIGPMHSGKSTAAKILSDLHEKETGQKVTTVSFAFELKERAIPFAQQRLASSICSGVTLAYVSSYVISSPVP